MLVQVRLKDVVEHLADVLGHGLCARSMQEALPAVAQSVVEQLSTAATLAATSLTEAGMNVSASTVSRKLEALLVQLSPTLVSQVCSLHVDTTSGCALAVSLCTSVVAVMP